MKNNSMEKSKLVKKYLEHRDWKDYPKALGKNKRGRGIYILYKGKEVYYIGLSKSSLRSRLRRHATRDRHKGNWDNFSFYQIGRTKYIKDIESLLLRVNNPPGNRVKGRFRKRYDLSNALRD
jgi:hypothetical protein